LEGWFRPEVGQIGPALGFRPAAPKNMGMSGTRLTTARWVVGAEREEEMWLALGAITLAAAIGFNVLALAIQDSER